jgi:tRNA (uracil-5-)-methyltransferase
MPNSAVQPQHYEQLLAAKVARVSDLLRPFAPPAPDVFSSPVTAFRMRAEFRMWHDGDQLDYVMYRKGDPQTPVPIREFVIACEPIQTLMAPLKDALHASDILRRKLFQLEFLSTLNGDTLVTLIYHRKLDEQWSEAATELAAQFNVVIVGRSRKQKVVLERDYVTETLHIGGRDYSYRQFEQAFTQPNALVNTRMIEWACARAAACQGDLLELYCGNGNFTLPLAQHFDHVIATELSKVSTRAAQHNLEINQIDNVHMIRLSAEEVSQAMAGERPFRRLAVLPKPLTDYQLDTVFVDPPRAGLDAATASMVAGFKTIIYISCNAETLAGNVAALQASHEITAFALFDQFPYTDHMECGVVLQQRMP